MTKLAFMATLGLIASCATIRPAPQGPIVDLTGTKPAAVTPPVLVESPNEWAKERAYPMRARQELREGVVVAHLTVDTDGSVASVEVVDDPGFDFSDAATALFFQFRFEPALRDGAPIASKIVCRMRFGLAP